MQKILLLEDDISLGNGIKMALQTSDIEITLCRTLAEAKTCVTVKRLRDKLEEVPSKPSY